MLVLDVLTFTRRSMDKQVSDGSIVMISARARGISRSGCATAHSETHEYILPFPYMYLRSPRH
jgi:hypothetical protein